MLRQNFSGQTRCIMGDWRIVLFLLFKICMDGIYHIHYTTGIQYNTIQWFCRKTGARSVLMYGTYLNDVKLSIILRRSTILKEPTSVVERSAQALWIQEI